jgi:hypothetical protein
MSARAVRRFKGAIHLHTTFSHDGVLTLPELASFLRGKGYDFLAITEHSQDMTGDKLALLERQSAELSGDTFLIIPGIEFNCTGTIHILGLGVTQLCASDDPSQVIDHVHACHGLAVLAHPSNKDYPIDVAWVKKLDGCEIWNNRHGKWLPQMHAVRKFGELSRCAPGLKAFAGLDLHGPKGYSHVAMVVRANSMTRDAVFEALRAGEYTAGGRFLTIRAYGRIGFFQKLYLIAFRTLLNIARWCWHRFSS